VRLTGTIKRWADSLPEDRRYLFPGVNIGSEASIGINFYHYPDGNALYDAHPTDDSLDPRSGMDMKKDFAGGLVPMGYAALDSKGWQHAGAVTLRDQERITADYLGFLAHVCRAAGLRRDQIFTHAGGQYAPWDLHYSHAVAINRDSLPGWSLYGTAPAAAGDLGASLDRAHLTAWAAAEWLPFATTAVQWRDAIDTTLGFKHCRFLSVYNWEGIRDHPEALAGIREALGSSDAHPNKAVSAPGTEGAVKEIRDRVLVHRETDFWTPALR
jgi:hypothetical protein